VTAVLTRPRPGGSAGAVRASCDRAVRHLASPGDLRRHGTTARADRNTRQSGIDPSALGGQVGLPIGTAVTARDPDPHSPDPPGVFDEVLADEHPPQASVSTTPEN
jgi:hypothetical protein